MKNIRNKFTHTLIRVIKTYFPTELNRDPFKILILLRLKVNIYGYIQLLERVSHENFKNNKADYSFDTVL